MKKTTSRNALAAASLLLAAACSELPQEPTLAAHYDPSFAVVGSAFSDDFTVFDETRWQRNSHPLGRGPLLASNVVPGDGLVSLMVSSSDYSGAEIMSRSAYGSGTFTVRGRCNVPSGAICAFFLYEAGPKSRADEIDIEIIPVTGEIWFTVWSNGRRTFSTSRLLSFDPAAALHTYSLQRSASEVRFSVDGVVLASFASRNKLPQTVMPLLANAWWPTWLNPAGGAGAWEIDFISVS
jgi:beta-glucanase (GH16 family)